MKVRALPQRDKSHKRLNDLVDLHALLWYVTEYDEITEAVHTHLNDDDIRPFETRRLMSYTTAQRGSSTSKHPFSVSRLNTYSCRQWVVPAGCRRSTASICLFE